MVLPHFAGGPVTAALEEAADKQGDFQTIQRSGTCTFRCVLAAFKFVHAHPREHQGSPFFVSLPGIC